MTAIRRGSQVRIHRNAPARGSWRLWEGRTGIVVAFRHGEWLVDLSGVSVAFLASELEPVS